MTAIFRTSACLRCPALWVRLLLHLPALPSPARACDQGARCPSAQFGILQAYRPPLWRKAPNCPSHRLSIAVPDIFSPLSVHMAVSSCSRTRPPACRAWLLVHAPFCTHIAACQFGMPLPKAWAFWCNHDVLSSLGCSCPHPPGFHPSLAGKRNSDGSFTTRHTACYPQPLASAIASCMQPFLSLLADPIKLSHWRTFLPPALIWPLPGPRIEDGAGTSSSAFWGLPRETDFLRPLRSLWLRRLETPGLLSGILSHMISPSKEPPISPAALRLFEADLRTFLQVDSDSTWAKLLSADAGQPFRLNLWHCLSVICCDPDMDFFRTLHEGVPLGIDAPIPPCKVLFPPESLAEPTIPLQRCDSAWKSALDHADLVDDLLAKELDEGWIRPVPGGDAELASRYRHTAVGKLGVARSPPTVHPAWLWTAPSAG